MPTLINPFAAMGYVPHDRDMTPYERKLYKKYIKGKQQLHGSIMRKAGVNKRLAKFLPEYSRARNMELNLLSEKLYRALEILHPVDEVLGVWKDRPMNLKHLSDEEQLRYKSWDRTRPPTPPPNLYPADFVICKIKEVPPRRHMFTPQSESTIGLEPAIGPVPGTFIVEERPTNSRGAEKYFNYRGQWKRAKMCGRGTYTFALGGEYTGMFQDNAQHGHGIASYTNSAVYDGEWKEGMYDGHGTQRFPNGAVYTGQFVKGYRCGHGKLVYPSGATYEGWWDKNAPHGRGTHTNTWGYSYTGNWEHGMIAGSGALTINGERLVRYDWPGLGFVETIRFVKREEAAEVAARQARMDALVGDLQYRMLQEDVYRWRAERDAEIERRKIAEMEERKAALKARRAAMISAAAAAREAAEQEHN